MTRNKVKKEKLVLLDAHAILHRAYHALPEFATSQGEPTGALYGFVAMILKIINELKPDHIVACYDLPKPTYRHEVYEGYKSGRAKADNDLITQIERSKDICAALNIPIYSLEGFEADDMLGTIVEQMRGKGIDIVIASGDMDTMQLVDDDYVKVYTLKKGIQDTVLYNEKAVKERFGFGPELLPDFKGLRGDPSDNIIGIAGIGEKSATDLIQNFGSIENIYKVLKKDRKKLEDKGIKKRIIDLLQEGEEEAKFSKMLATIRRDAPIAFALPDKNWRQGLDLDRALALFESLQFRTLAARFKALVTAGAIMEVVKPDTAKKEEIDPTELEEAKLALWIVDSNITNPELEDILNFAETASFAEAKKIIFDELKKMKGEKIFEEIEKPLVPIVKKMERRGVLIDAAVFKKLRQTYSRKLGELESRIWEEAGTKFNIASPKQLGEVLFDKLNLSVKRQKKTSTGARSTQESELQKMKDAHPIVPLILEYRETSKLLSTYIEPIPKLLDKDSRLHARFVQTGTTTGRMSSINPNLQNIPAGGNGAKAIREAFIAPEGYRFVAFDYSQIELRIAAFLSGDGKLIEIFKNNEDVHSSVAAYVFGVPKDEVTKEMRRKAKVINFGILYGMGVNALTQNLGSDRQTAQEFYNAYFEQFQGLAKYLDEAKQKAAREGFTETFFGRRRYFEGLNSKIPYVKASAERMAINAPIQGTEADVIKIAMKRIDDFLVQKGLESKVYLILQIHDELIYEIEENLVESIAPEIKEIMQNVLPLRQTKGVPITADYHVGKNWGDME